MANNEIHARIKNKVNPALSSVLLDGELAVLRANGKSMLKIGNGSSALSDIGYVEMPWDQISAWVEQAKSAVSVDGEKTDINVQHISQDDYAALVATSAVLSNTIYIVSGDHIEAYGQQMKNLAPGTDLSDAVNLEQLNSLSSKFYQFPANGIPGSDMALSVQTAIEKAKASISSIPSPVDPLSAAVSGQYADALATKNLLLGKVDLATAADPLIPMTGHVAVLNSNGSIADSRYSIDTVLRYKLENAVISSGSVLPTYVMKDRTITAIDVPEVGSTATADAVLTLKVPAQTAGYARDFIVELDVPPSSYAIDFDIEHDAASAPISVVVDDNTGTFPTADEGEVNIFSFTEISPGCMLVSKKNVYAVGSGS